MNKRTTEYHVKVLFNGFHFKSNTSGFRAHTRGQSVGHAVDVLSLGRKDYVTSQKSVSDKGYYNTKIKD